MAHLLHENADGFESVQEWTNILSGGEAQRIGFARLFFHHPKMAFMDVRTTQPQSVKHATESYSHADVSGAKVNDLSSGGGGGVRGADTEDLVKNYN